MTFGPGDPAVPGECLATVVHYEDVPDHRRRAVAELDRHARSTASALATACPVPAMIVSVDERDGASGYPE